MPPNNMTPRPYQLEDYAKVLDEHRSHQCVIGQAATGTGKSVLLAMVAQHYMQTGRVIALVDTIKLAQQLVGTFERYLGIPVGLERGESEARNETVAELEFDKAHTVGAHKIIVATVQTLFCGAEGDERFNKFDPAEFSLLELDEAELYFPNKASRKPVNHFLTNPNLKCLGVTATPFRSDKIGYRNLFSSLAFTRDRLWGEQQGWLVHPNQCFVRVSLDFSTLKLNRNRFGEKDYSEEQIAATLNNKETIIELAKGIIEAAGDRKSIVICPAGKDEHGRRAAIARALAHKLEEKQSGCARCIYGDLGEVERDDIFDGHRRGEFQFLTAVSMINKGYNDPTIRAVFICRKTRSKRMYQQIVGRGVRPWETDDGISVVDGLETSEQRIAAIAGSPKVDCLVANLVGIDGSVRDCTLVDLYGEIEEERVTVRAKELVEEGADTEKAVEQAQQELEAEQDQARMEADAAQAVLEDQEHELRERAILSSVEVQGAVEIEAYDDPRINHGASGQAERTICGVSESQYRFMKRFGYPDSVIAEKGNRLHRWIFGRLRKKLVVSYRLIMLLRRLGATNKTISGMTNAVASAFIESKLGKRRAG
jgi:superfamily II DNA or RNA helicase